MMLRRLFQIISWIAFGLTMLPSILFFAGKMDLDRVKLWMLIATVAWFAATPLWMGREKSGAAAPQETSV
jgi:hypothetical protein